jgi:hypothetical protein
MSSTGLACPCHLRGVSQVGSRYFKGNGKGSKKDGSGDEATVVACGDFHGLA